MLFCSTPTGLELLAELNAVLIQDIKIPVTIQCDTKFIYASEMYKKNRHLKILCVLLKTM
jgi:hypothetical protein